MQIRRIRWAAVFLLSLAFSLALVACGGGNHPASTTKTVSHLPKTVASACPPNQSFMGCSAKARPQAFGVQPFKTLPAGPEFPDVSNWQGNVNWSLVAQWQRGRGWHPAAIFKMGEFSLDRFAVRNATQLASLGFWHAGYWFVRPWSSGCGNEAGLIQWAALRLGLKVVVLDEEVPGIAGYASCITPVLRRAGLVVVLYTAPGTWPGGSNAGLSVWVASYGPSHPPCIFGICTVGALGRQSILAFQFTDGQFGSPVTIPGIGRDDVSVDYGITKLGVPKPKPPKPKPAHCLAQNFPHTAGCFRVRFGYNATEKDLAKVQGRLRQFHCSARKHPRFCGGWFWAQGVDRRKLAEFRRRWA